MNHVSSTDFILLSSRFTEEQTGNDSDRPISNVLVENSKSISCDMDDIKLYLWVTLLMSLRFHLCWDSTLLRIDINHIRMHHLVQRSNIQEYNTQRFDLNSADHPIRLQHMSIFILVLDKHCQYLRCDHGGVLQSERLAYVLEFILVMSHKLLEMVYISVKPSIGS